MNVSLTPEADRYVHSKVDTGRCNSASEVLRDALRLMQDRNDMHEVRLAEARLQIENGLDALSSGRFVEGTSREHFESAIARSRERTAARANPADGPKV